MRFSYTYYSGDDYDNLVKKFDNYSLLQSHKWGKIKEGDWKTKRVVFYEGDEVVAVVSILIRKLFSNKNFIYIPYGPLMDYNNKELLSFVTNSFKEIAKDTNSIYLKIVPPIFNDNSISKDLITNGWIENKTDKSFDSIQPKLNAVVHNDFKLTKRMKQDRRTTENKNVRSVYTFDFRVKELSDNLLNDFYELTRLTEKRQGIKLRNKDYFKSLLDNYPNSFITVSYIDRNKRADKLIEELKADNDKDKKVTAFCRNIAPLVGIDEECATGTSNGALTHYLKEYNIISAKDINSFRQGEAMQRASTILSRYKEDGMTIQVGGNAVISFECKIYE